LKKHQFRKNDVVVVIISGRGDKDMDTYIKYMENSPPKGPA
jgi:tryptophan synthase beta subunit